MPTVTVGYGVTDKQGNFSLDADSSKLDSSYNDVLGDLSLEYKVVSGGSMADYAAHTPRIGDQNLDIDLQARSVRETTTKFVAPSKLTMTRTLAQPTRVTKASKLAVMHAAASVSTSTRIKPSAGGPVYPPCVTTVVKSLNKMPEYFTHAWTRNGIQVDITENQGSTHTTQIGVSANGTTWGVSGSETWATGVGAGASHTSTTSEAWGNSVNYSELKTACGLPTGSTTYALRWTGLHTPLDVHYVNYLRPGVAVTKDYSAISCSNPITSGYIHTLNSNTQTYAGGVSLGLMSLDVSQQLSSDTDLKFNYTGTRFVVCYNTAGGMKNATDLEAHQV